MLRFNRSFSGVFLLKQLGIMALVLLLPACTQLNKTLGKSPTNGWQTLTADQQHAYLQAIQSLKNQQLKSALKIFKQLQESHPDFAGAWLGEGDVYIQQQQWQAALQTLARAEQLRPDWPLIYTRQAYCFRKLGQFGQAQHAYQKALQLKPDYALAHYNYAILLDLYLHETSKAIQHFEHYQRLQSTADPQVERWLKELKRRDPKSAL